MPPVNPLLKTEPLLTKSKRSAANAKACRVNEKPEPLVLRLLLGGARVQPSDQR